MSTLYVSDLDGTLLQNDAVLSAFTEATLRGLLADGLMFTVASARSVVSMQTMLRGLSLSLPVIEFNGAFLSDLATGRHEMINALDPGVVNDIYAQMLRHGLPPLVSSFDGTDDRVHHGAVLNAGMLWYLDDRRNHHDRRWRGAADDLSACLRETVVCLTVIAEEPALADLRAEIMVSHGASVEMHLFENQYSPGWHWLTVHDRRATKDQAIRTLVERYSLAGREIVVFGDQVNDLKMFKIADRAVAVGNAAEAVKHQADAVIGANDTDSVAKFLQADSVRRR